MGTTTVGARIDSEVLAKASHYIKQAGSSNTEVIKTVFENIAETGTLPFEGATAPASQSTSTRLKELQDSTSFKPGLSSLEDDEARELLAERDSRGDSHD